MGLGDGEGLLGLDDLGEWDAAFERGERNLGTAAIGLAFNCPWRTPPRASSARRSFRTPTSGASPSRRWARRRG
ncbi:hypothetical protein ACFQV4_36325 [Streptomyces thermocarboxydus]